MRTYVVAVLILLGVPAGAEGGGSEWQLEPDADGCAFIQREPNSTNRIEISRSPSTDEVDVSIADARLKVSNFTPLPNVGIALEPGSSRVGVGHLLRETDERPAVISVMVEDPSFLPEFAQSATVTVSNKSIEVRRNVRSPAQAARGLADCEDAKLRSWGIDPAYLRRLQKRPRPVRPLRSLLDVSDYPPGYLLNGIEGRVLVRLMVGSDGKVQDCTGLGRRVDRFFLKNVCDKFRRHAEFEPAVDRQGTTVAVPYVIAVGFGIES